jgi:hypothetical protein
MAAFIGSVLGALLVVLLSTLLIRVLFLLVWKPFTVTRWFRGQGVGGPGYRFFVGSVPEIRRMKAAGSEVVLDAGSHDFIRIVQPQFRKWVADYGTYIYIYIGILIILHVIAHNSVIDQ